MKAPDKQPKSPAQRRRVARAATLWGLLALSGTTILASLVIWHLVRRGRLIRESLAPPKPGPALERNVPPSEPA